MAAAVSSASAPAAAAAAVGMPGPELSRNYASHECGAKVIAANPEAEGTAKVSPLPSYSVLSLVELLSPSPLVTALFP